MASVRTMLRSGALALLVFAVSATSAAAATPTFEFPVGGHLYSPTQITLAPSDTSVCWSPQAVDFSEHPLVLDGADLPGHASGTSDYCPSVTSLRPGFYAFHCALHGHAGDEGAVGTGMAGSFTIPGDTTATPEFSISQSGAGATFTYTGGADPDPGDNITKYLWDFDGNGRTDATSTASSVQHTYTANGTFHPTLRVVDLGHTQSAPVSHDITITGIPDPTPPTQPPPGGGGATPPSGGGGGQTYDTTAPVVHLTIAKRLTVATALRVPFTTDEPASVVVTLRVAKKTAKARKRFGTAGKHTLTIRLSKTLRRLLHKRRSVTLTLTVTDDAGNRTTLKRTLKLRVR